VRQCDRSADRVIDRTHPFTAHAMNCSAGGCSVEEAERSHA
jgi:hypothetical protein